MMVWPPSGSWRINRYTGAIQVSDGGKWRPASDSETMQAKAMIEEGVA